MFKVYSWSNPMIAIIDYKTQGEKAVKENPRVNLNDVSPYRDVPPSAFEIMQYTGLLDKNEKEIYEGDIITGQKARGTVVYNDDLGCYLIADGWSEHGREIVWKNLEIIGNIYEHKHLLSRTAEEMEKHLEEFKKF